MMNDEQFWNLVNLVALIIGIENLYENQQQSAYNDVHASNQKQAEYLLNEINARFDEQNRILAKILERMERNDRHGHFDE